ncbi:hypothetical protein DKT77_00595 [Meridianimarinicoccus roseus]|uniref:DUF1772 domain-containing protein n=1 Tax=Meridianimarinicoccus roseus TaxID=2072018 RepID=A0A2V2LFU2_9RHOB|nr:hypothetical protein [Meridianimarinicoccus roseus]PWR04500.1 hypothetical protein DKT77_00595 [Meridianimarinicoccus roseus]
MTPETYRKTVNLTTVIASAAFAGGGLLILVSYGIRWLGMDSLVWRAGFWDEFLNFALTIIPLNLVTLVGLVLSVRLDWQNRAARRLWMWAVRLYFANALFTLGYFIPQNILLILDSYTASEASTVRATWLGLHVIRVAIALAVPVFALLAVFERSERAAT